MELQNKQKIRIGADRRILGWYVILEQQRQESRQVYMN